MRSCDPTLTHSLDQMALLPSPRKATRVAEHPLTLTLTLTLTLCRATTTQQRTDGRTFGHLGESLAVFGQINVVKLVVVIVLSIITGIVVCVVVVALPVRECRFN